MEKLDQIIPAYNNLVTEYEDEHGRKPTVKEIETFLKTQLKECGIKAFGQSINMRINLCINPVSDWCPGQNVHYSSNKAEKQVIALSLQLSAKHPLMNAFVTNSQFNLGYIAIGLLVPKGAPAIACGYDLRFFESIQNGPNMTIGYAVPTNPVSSISLTTSIAEDDLQQSILNTAAKLERRFTDTFELVEAIDQIITTIGEDTYRRLKNLINEITKTNAMIPISYIAMLEDKTTQQKIPVHYDKPEGRKCILDALRAYRNAKTP